jgi:predicted DNA-binding transcriptional regulator AlpA
MRVELVGMAEIAELLGVELETVHTWRHRGVLPEPFTLVSDRPAWRLEVVLGWAESTGRLEPKRKADPEGPTSLGSEES